MKKAIHMRCLLMSKICRRSYIFAHFYDVEFSGELMQKLVGEIFQQLMEGWGGGLGFGLKFWDLNGNERPRDVLLCRNEALKLAKALLAEESRWKLTSNLRSIRRGLDIFSWKLALKWVFFDSVRFCLQLWSFRRFQSSSKFLESWIKAFWILFNFQQSTGIHKIPLKLLFKLLKLLPIKKS
jgi:hypothetical protein